MVVLGQDVAWPTQNGSANNYSAELALLMI